MTYLEKTNAKLIKRNELLTRRLRHLLESKYIRSFDEVHNGEYVRNIEDADKANPIVNPNYIYADNINYKAVEDGE